MAGIFRYRLRVRTYERIYEYDGTEVVISYLILAVSHNPYFTYGRLETGTYHRTKSRLLLYILKMFLHLKNTIFVNPA